MTLRTPREPAPGQGHDHTATIIGAVVVTLAIGIGGIIVKSEQSAVIVGLVGPSVVSLLALLRIEQALGRQGETKAVVDETHQAVQGVSAAVNGELDRRMERIAETVVQRITAGQRPPRAPDDA